MSTSRTTVGVTAVLVAAALAGWFFARPRATPGAYATVAGGPFTVTATYEGEIESRHVESVMSRLSGVARIAEIAQEGSVVTRGDVLVRFGASQIEQDLIKQEREFALAECELENLEKARLPIEISDLENELLEAGMTYTAEKRYLDETGDLLKDNLISKEELENQQLKTRRLEQRLKSVELKLQLTREHTHPSALKKARSALAGAGQAMALARQQYSNCTVRAPIDGIVVYKPLHIGTEYRTVRVGDSVYENQPFMMIPDLSNLVVQCNIPETEFSRVRSGVGAAVVPVAYAGVTIQGRVESVTSMAQSMFWGPNWQKYFRATIALDGNDDRLRPGMSVHVHIQSYRNEDAVLVPRAAVFWRGDTPYCRVASSPGRPSTVDVTLGRGNETHYEVLSGLKPGDKVSLETP